MLSFHNDPAIKAKYVNRLQAHRDVENLIQGKGWTSDGKGCAVGCTLEQYDHSRYPVELGLPEWLARLEDRIFEGLPKGDAEQFAVGFLNAIPVGSDLSKVGGLLAIERHTLALVRLEGNSEPYAEQVREALRNVIEFLKTGENRESAARSAAESARSAAESARSAAESAWSAARSAAWSAAESAWSAAESAWSAAEFEHYKWEAATLLRLLASAPQA